MKIKAKEMIAEQQKGHEKETLYMIGMQLIDMIEKGGASADLIAELLAEDLTIPRLSLEAAEEYFQSYADNHKGGANSFCITPDVADKLLRKFYGLPDPAEAARKTNHIDLSEFL